MQEQWQHVGILFCRPLGVILLCIVHPGLFPLQNNSFWLMEAGARSLHRKAGEEGEDGCMLQKQALYCFPSSEVVFCTHEGWEEVNTWLPVRQV